jgi:hypothetical protein
MLRHEDGYLGGALSIIFKFGSALVVTYRCGFLPLFLYWCHFRFVFAVLGQFVVCDDERVCQALSGAFDFNMMIVSQVSLNLRLFPGIPGWSWFHCLFVVGCSACCFLLSMTHTDSRREVRCVPQIPVHHRRAPLARKQGAFLSPLRVVRRPRWISSPNFVAADWVHAVP